MEESISAELSRTEDSTEGSGVMQGILQRGTDHPMTRCLEGKSVLELLTQSWLKVIVLLTRRAS